ncbi:D-alanyl-D-alanine carboxypeptidase family protein [Anaeromicropila herbilytica]|uniref:Peptidase S11 D-alanyl-D-alanine carboxypeptidase A N-terminal domain-containing protein n=1 Tax=Anaeromicropila herbilytica TaxID=2785025 RepID=A0A7R7IC49_9FIRM|nr:D-alanyl-D-alanine carboxypeptidase [Anaeromicropila herbilytica]BCN30348.1 hypothetical protein bsdtb5_16430 [Anaeromicropila herbilytica]
MKKYKYLINILLIITILSSFLCPTEAFAAANTVPKVHAHAYIVMDANSGKILLKQNANKRIYPASTAKLMTAIVSIESKNAGKNIKTSAKVLRKIPSDASTVHMPAGVSYTFTSLLHMLLIASAADAAQTLAVGTYGSTNKFIHQMNHKAKELNMTHTSFDNTIGLDIGNHYYKTYTTASDFAILARYAMSKKAIRNIVAKKNYIIPKTRKSKRQTIKSTNLFYSTAPYSKNLYQIIGTKTGTTNAAGKVLIVTAKDNKGHEVICAFFGNSTKTALYQDIKKLLDYTFKNYKNGNITLSKGFYDTRFTKYESLIRNYYNKGQLSGSSDGEFKPKDKVTESAFINTMKAISNAELQPMDSKKKITILDFSEILDEAYPAQISDDDYDVIVPKLTSDKELSTDEYKSLVALYTSNLLPDNITFDVDTCLTKVDMVIIADKMIDFVNNYEANPVSDSGE